MRRTVVFPINLNKQETSAILETMDLFSKVFKVCFDVAWEMENPNGIAVHDATYYNVRSKFGLKSQFSCSARNKAVEMAKSAKALFKKGKKVSKPNFDKIPIRFDARTLSFNKDRSYASIATQQGRIKVPLYWHKHAIRYRDWACKAGEIGIDRKGKLEFRLVFETEVARPERTGKVIGIDRGIKKAIVTSDGKFIGEKEWKEIERRYFSHIARLQAKGTKSAKRRLEKISGRWERFKKNCDYIAAKELVSALEAGDTLVCENLTGIKDRCGKKGQSNKKHRSHIGRWPYKRTENFIKHVAEIKGIYVEYVDPRYTSQTCSKCGVICKSNRKSQSFYSCSCGCKLNADLNAARNIAYKWCMANGYPPGPSVNRPIVASASRSA